MKPQKYINLKFVSRGNKLVTSSDQIKLCIADLTKAGKMDIDYYDIERFTEVERVTGGKGGIA